MIANPLRFLLPPWIHEGGMEAMLERLAEPYTRARIKQKLVEVGFTNFGRLRSWDDIRIANSPTATAGKTIETLARERGQDPLDVACDIIIADRGATRILVRSMSEEDVQRIVTDPMVMVGSDGPCVAPYGITGQGKPHPRLYGTFPRVLGHYARDLGLLGLPQAVFKMTGGAAMALGLADRGTIAVGNAADLVISDRTGTSIRDRCSSGQSRRNSCVRRRDGHFRSNKGMLLLGCGGSFRSLDDRLSRLASSTAST